MDIKVWGQTKPNGIVKLHIQDGIAPYKATFFMNNEIKKIVTNIPQPKFFKTIIENDEYQDINCMVEDLPAGDYKIYIKDSYYPPNDAYIFNIKVKNNLSKLRKKKLLNFKMND